MYEFSQFAHYDGQKTAYLFDHNGLDSITRYFFWRPGDQYNAGKWDFYTQRRGQIDYLATDVHNNAKRVDSKILRCGEPTTLPCSGDFSPEPSLIVYEGTTQVKTRSGSQDVRVRTTAFNRNNGSLRGRTCTLVEEYIGGAWRKIGTAWEPDLPGVPFPYSPEWRSFWHNGELKNVWAMDYMLDAAEHFMKAKHPGFDGRAVDIFTLRDSFALV